MTRKDFLKAVSLARDPSFKAIPYVHLRAFDGCALDNKRRAVTLTEVASLLRGHCVTFTGEWLHNEQDEIEVLSKRFDIVGE